MVPDLTPAEVEALLRSGAATLVDVREDDEWAAGRIRGAIHIPLGSLGERAAEVPADRPVVFYCRAGSRSAMAAEAFAASGFDARNMAGGLTDWAGAGLPLEPADGRVA